MLGLLYNIDNRGDGLFLAKMSRYVRFPACTRVKRTGEYLSSPDAERTPETVCLSRLSAVSWFRLPGQGARDDRAQISARGRWSGTHACRPPGAKMLGIYARSIDARDMCPVCSGRTESRCPPGEILFGMHARLVSPPGARRPV